MTTGAGSDANSPARILVAGDWHGNNTWACRVARALPELLPEEPEPLILQLGDFGLWPGRAGGKYLLDLTVALADAGGRLWFVHGNHEDHTRLAARRPDKPQPVPITDRITWLPTGTRWSWHDRTWVALGGAVSVDRALRTEGLDWWPTEELSRELADAVIADGPADVMACHDRPAQAPLMLPPPAPAWDIADLARSAAHRERVQTVVDALRPALVMHGHYHLARDEVVHMAHGPVDVIALNLDGEPDNVLVLNVVTGHVQWPDRWSTEGGPHP